MAATSFLVVQVAAEAGFVKRIWYTALAGSRAAEAA
jgi:hypothetical protein